MSSNMSIGERYQIVSALAPQALDAAKTSAYQSMANRFRVLAVVTTGTVAATKKVTVQLKQATDSSGTGAKNLGTAVEATAGTGGEAIFLTAEAAVGDLDIANGYSHVAVSVSTDDTNEPEAAAILLFDPAFRS